MSIGATWTERIEVTRKTLRDARIGTVSEVGDLAASGVRLGKGFGVTVGDVVNGIHIREVGIESGAVIGGADKGVSFRQWPRCGGEREQGCFRHAEGGPSLSDVTGHKTTR